MKAAKDGQTGWWGSLGVEQVKHTLPWFTRVPPVQQVVVSGLGPSPAPGVWQTQAYEQPWRAESMPALMSALRLGAAAARVAMARRMAVAVFMLFVLLVLRVLLCCLGAFLLSVAGNQRDLKAKGGRVFIHEKAAATLKSPIMGRFKA